MMMSPWALSPQQWGPTHLLQRHMGKLLMSMETHLPPPPQYHLPAGFTPLSLVLIH